MIPLLHNLTQMITGVPPTASGGLILTAFSDLTVILVAALVAQRLAAFFKIPDVITFLLIGVVLGPTIPFWVPIRTDSIANQLVVIFGASYILFQGGLELNLRTIARYARIIALLAVGGVIVSTFIIGGAAALIFPILPLSLALLVGVILAPTDPATLIPILKQVRVSERLETVIESESAFNDTTSAIIFVTLVAFLQQGHASLIAAAGNFLREMTIGFGCGAGLGLLAGLFISYRPIGIFRENASVLTLPVALGSYTIAERLGGSGYLAAFIGGGFLGNCRQLMPGFFRDEQELKLEIFSMDLSLICRMLIFVILGSQINFAEVARYWSHGLILLGVYIFISRPAVVFMFFGLDRKNRWSLKEKIFLSWVREAGVMPAALAGSLATISLNLSSQMGDTFNHFVQAIVFMAILATLLIQAMSTPWLARRLGVSKSE